MASGVSKSLAFVLAVGASSAALGAGEADLVGLYDELRRRFSLDSLGDGGDVDWVTKLSVQGQKRWQPLSGDLDGDGDDTVAMYSPSSGKFHLRRSIFEGPADSVVKFGPRHDGVVGLLGDWNGDGIDTVGVYDPLKGVFHMHDRIKRGRAKAEVRFGPKNSRRLPIVGDWTGDGTDNVGLFDPITQKFHLRKSNLRKSSKIVAKLRGKHKGAQPLVGDWNGDGTDTIGLHDAPEGLFLLRNKNSDGKAHKRLRFGSTDSDRIPLSGKWAVPVGGLGKESVTLAWTPPTGEVNSGRAGYRVYYGVRRGLYPNVIRITDPGKTTFKVPYLPKKVLYFVMTAYDRFGNESEFSNVAIKRFD